MMVIGGTIRSFGIFFQPLLSEFGWTRAMTSGAFSLYMVLHGGLCIIAGRLTDKFGPRLVLTGCGLFVGSGYLLMSQVSAIWQLYLFYGVIIGIGMSGGAVPLLSTVSRWFIKKRGMMISIVASGVGLGTMIISPMAGWLISIYGWRFSYIVMGIIVLTITVIAAQFLRRDPAQKGLFPHGDSEVQQGSPVSETNNFSFREAIHTKQLWMLCIVFLSAGTCIHAIMVHIIPHAIDLGISAASATSILITISGVSIVGRIVIGSAGDRIGNKMAIIISSLLMLAALLWLLLARELWMLYLFSIVFGLAYGVLILMAPLVAWLFGLKSHGIIFGVVDFSATIGGAIGPVLLGSVFDVTGSYQTAFVICIAFTAVVVITAIFLKPIEIYPSRMSE